MPHEHPHLDHDGFRLRGTGPSRVDGFSRSYLHAARNRTSPEDRDALPYAS